MSMHGVYSEGVLVNPGAGAILADTGAAAIDDSHDLTLLLSSSITAVIVLERRDAANTGNVWAHTIPLGALAPLLGHVGNVIVVNQGERLRLRLNTAIVGQVQGTIVIG